MRNQNRVCAIPGCPTISDQTRCPRHRAMYGQTSGTTTQRGYGAPHRRARDDWAPQVEAGHVTCWRCRTTINPGQPWHLGHDDHRNTAGPEHRDCNLAAARQR